MVIAPTQVRQPAEAIEATDLDSGLSQHEVRARQARCGFNEVPEKKVNLWLMFARKFWGLSAWMIELILVLSWMLRKYSDLYVVSALLVVNAILSYAQEQRASAAVEALCAGVYRSAPGCFAGAVGGSSRRASLYRGTWSG